MQNKEIENLVLIKMKYLHIILPVVILFSASCQKDEIIPVTNTTGQTAARDALYDLMKDWYLWYDEMPKDLTISNYNDPFELLNTLRYKSRDRWSFVADYESFTASMQGSFIGHGIRMGLDETNKVRIIMIYKNSPLYSKGVRRGWVIQKLNGDDLAQVFISGDGEKYNTLIGPSQEGYRNTFLFKTPLGKDSTIVTAKAKFQVNSVLMDTTYNLNSGKTAYLVFNEFIEPSPGELKTSFAFFKQENVKDLILDMRYNTGGILSVATELASYLSGLTSTNVLVKSEYNNKQASNNSTITFKSVLYPLNLKRLVVISTRETASASEVIINGLKPYFTEVVCIGDTTNGKPTGMNVWNYKNKYAFAPVTFRLVNSAGQGDFYDGFPPAKYVPDDFSRDFGDRNELCLKEAIYYLEHGAVSSKGAYIYRRQQHFSEGQELMNNTYDIDPVLFKK
jgi:carboxyl-terminal processing protease